jgi:hypothetical protein
MALQQLRPFGERLLDALAEIALTGLDPSSVSAAERPLLTATSTMSVGSRAATLAAPAIPSRTD